MNRQDQWLVPLDQRQATSWFNSLGLSPSLDHIPQLFKKAYEDEVGGEFSATEVLTHPPGLMGDYPPLWGSNHSIPKSVAWRYFEDSLKIAVPTAELVACPTRAAKWTAWMALAGNAKTFHAKHEQAAQETDPHKQVSLRYEANQAVASCMQRDTGVYYHSLKAEDQNAQAQKEAIGHFYSYWENQVGMQCVLTQAVLQLKPTDLSLSGVQNAMRVQFFENPITHTIYKNVREEVTERTLADLKALKEKNPNFQVPPNFRVRPGIELHFDPDPYTQRVFGADKAFRHQYGNGMPGMLWASFDYFRARAHVALQNIVTYGNGIMRSSPHASSPSPVIANTTPPVNQPSVKALIDVPGHPGQYIPTTPISRADKPPLTQAPPAGVGRPRRVYI